MRRAMGSLGFPEPKCSGTAAAAAAAGWQLEYITGLNRSHSLTPFSGRWVPVRAAGHVLYAPLCPAVTTGAGTPWLARLQKAPLIY